MNLFFQKFGNGEPLLILHGLYGSSDNWVSIAKQLSDNWTVYLVDQRNHGRSPHHPEHTYNLMCEDLHGFFIQQGIEKVVIIGHSMGGKTTMYYAAKYPEKVKAIVVVDIAPAGYASLNEYSPQALMHLNIIDALLALDLLKYTTRNEIEEELSRTITNGNVRQFLMKNIHRNADGSFNWKINIDALSKALPEIMGPLYFDKIKETQFPLQFPALFIRGGKSNYLLPHHYPEIKQYFANTQFETIPNAGHWVHAEQPVLFMKTIVEFLERL